MTTPSYVNVRKIQ
ncbi:TPA: hypothetical protein N0F65_004140 [Lagenidium giganteum]|uniref:Uncharacterized protein n=1 Tax=Lagenidium giganteum TaxID=4803 RepID=A0AAV2ZF43_9STRA|nr:TPA: hypothetical protein N0F65_004140 [Lagenidium giganteum]